LPLGKRLQIERKLVELNCAAWRHLTWKEKRDGVWINIAKHLE
jgi:hypothetical protein